VAVHEVIGKADGDVFRCTLSGSDADRWLEVPAWMFERMACPDQRHLATSPLVSMRALTALSYLIGSASKNLSPESGASPSGASGSSHDQNRREAHDLTDIGAAVTHTGAESQAPTKRRSSADRPVRLRAADFGDADAGVAGAAEGDQNDPHGPADAVTPSVLPLKYRPR
jgi:hypothetical protein